MGDGGVGVHFHRFLRGFPRFCAPNYIVKNFSYLTYVTRTFKPTKEKNQTVHFFVLFIIPNRTLTLNQTRTPTFKPTDKN
jgi:hypothetical protein